MDLSSEPCPSRLKFTKGHGTGNDFVLFSDPEGRIDFSPEMAAYLANRHTGVGGDGVIRAVLSAQLPEGRTLLETAPEATWFMDYRNADGSVAEMCGNGVRVFTAYLIAHGLEDVPDGASVVIGTRAGACTVARMGQEFSVDMGEWSFPGGQGAIRRGSDRQVTVEGLDRPLGGLSVSVGNPHVVAAVTAEELAGLDLSNAPVLTPPASDGANVEFVVVSPVSMGDEEGEITLRVHERGAGETLSCGTGACAAALAAWAWSGPAGPTTWTVHVPGGTLRVRMLGDIVELAGPAELVFQGSLLV